MTAMTTTTPEALATPTFPTEPDVLAPKPARRPRAIGLHIALTLGLVVMIMPFVWMLLSSFKLTREVRQTPPTWIPEEPTTQNYRDLFDRLDFPRFFVNSTVAAVAVTAGNLLFCSMLGYALAKLEFPGKRILMGFMLGTLMIPAFVTFMPLFVIVANMNLTNTRWGLILPFLAGAFGAFLMRQFITGIPDDLLDAARVDGAGEFRIFFRIVLPLCGPALATLAVLTFLTQWNSFLWPLVVASSEEQWTLPVALALFSIGEQRSEVALQMAGATAVVVPVVVLFFAMQRYVIRGVATTGIK
jgi:multiple sugar transport system permease protein